MGNMNRFIALICILQFSIVRFSYAALTSKNLKHITEENWRQILSGEWMIEFHAPWCPACKDLHKAWNAFADWSKDLSISVGEIDVTENPGLSGRFLITSLPTIYHIKDGVFRLYAGPRDTEDFTWFVEEAKWKLVDPLPAWKNPDSIQMAIVAKFFKLSMAVRDLHNDLVENYGVPPTASYAIFAGITLLLGSILGVVIVYMIDRIFPTKSAQEKEKEKNENKKQKKKEKQKQKNANGKVPNGEAEKDKKDSDEDSGQNSQSESQHSQSDEEKEDGLRQRKNDKKIVNGKSQASSQKKK